MATQAAFREQHEALSAVIRAWERRARAQRALRWLPFGLSAGLAAGGGVALVARLFPVLAAGQAAALALVALALAAALTPLLAWLRPRSGLDSARHFDLLFGLNERTSTALELAEGRIHTHAELAARQLADAWQTAHAVDARARLPLRPGGRVWLLPAALAVALALLLLSNPQAEAASQNAARDTALADARDSLADITQETAAASALTEEQREPLLQQLERAAETLSRPEVTAEEAFAALTGAAADMGQMAAALERQAGDSRAADQQAAAALREAAPPPEGQGQGEQPPGAIPTLEQVAEQVPQMSAQQRADAVRALEAAAAALEATNPQAAEALRAAAEALRQGDTQAAQGALARASESLQAGQQQAQRQQQGAEQMSAGAQQLQQSAEQVARSQNQQAGQQQAAQMQQGGEQPAEGLQALGQQPGEQGGEQGEQGQAGASSQPGEQAGQQGQQDGARGIRPAQQGQDSATAGLRSDEPGGVGSGAGDQPGGVGEEDSGLAGRADAAATNNRPDGQGEGEFAEVYAPQRAGGEGGPQLVLEPDGSGQPVVEGEFSENPTGEALVPYSRVFGSYRRSASRALDRSYIPLGMRDIVRDYFSSLEPRAAGGE